MMGVTLLAWQWATEGKESAIAYALSPAFWIGVTIYFLIQMLVWAFELLLGMKRFLQLLGFFTLILFYIAFIFGLYLLFCTFFMLLAKHFYEFEQLVPVEYIQYKSSLALLRIAEACANREFLEEYTLEVWQELRILYNNLFYFLILILKFFYMSLLTLIINIIKLGYGIVYIVGLIIQKIKDLFK